MAKIIKKLDLDLSSLPASGETRAFQVIGDAGAIFSLDIKNEDDYWYDFVSGTFASGNIQSSSRLKNKIIPEGGSYNGSIKFPSITDNDHYDIFLFAENAFDTEHAQYKEVRFGDGSIDINSCEGSGSNLIQKIIYQYTDTTVTLSARSARYTAGFASVSITNDTVVVGRNQNSGKVPFTVKVAVAATKAMRILTQPTARHLYYYEPVTLGTGQVITGENIWTAVAKGTRTGGNGGSSSVDINLTSTLPSAVTEFGPVGYRVTGTSTDDLLNDHIVLVEAYDAAAPSITISKEVAVANGTTLSFTPPSYHRWSINASSSMHNLRSGMRVSFSTGADADIDTVSGRTAVISNFEDTTDYVTETMASDGSVRKATNTAVNFSSPALDNAGYKPTITEGKITKQLGNVTFDQFILHDATNRAMWIYNYGVKDIKSVLGTDIIVSDLAVELTDSTYVSGTKPKTNTSGAVSASATIGVDDREGIIDGVSQISGIGIAAGAVNPTINSGGGADGAGNWTASAAQTLEDNIELTIENTSRFAIITGNIEFLNVDTASFTLYFDMDSFLSAS